MAQYLLLHGWLVLLKTGACGGLPIFFEVTTNWRAGCQKLARPVRREGRPASSSLPLSAPAKWLGPSTPTMYLRDGALGGAIRPLLLLLNRRGPSCGLARNEGLDTFRKEGIGARRT